MRRASITLIQFLWKENVILIPPKWNGPKHKHAISSCFHHLRLTEKVNTHDFVL